MECRLHHDIHPILDKYCIQESKKEAIMMVLEFELTMDPDPKQKYTALINEVRHGEFELKVVHYKPKDKVIGPAKHDIVLPGRYVSGSIVVRLHNAINSMFDLPLKEI